MYKNYNCTRHKKVYVYCKLCTAESFNEILVDTP